jgi:hypothetical protein
MNHKGANAMVHDEEIVAARSTFAGFVTLFKVGTIAAALVGFLVILLIAPK